MSEKIVEKTIKKLLSEAPDKGFILTFDTEIPGFCVRVTAAGVVSFVLAYRVGSTQRRYTIGRWPELSATAARNEAIELRGRIREGRDPQMEKESFAERPRWAIFWTSISRAMNWRRSGPIRCATTSAWRRRSS